MSSRSVAISDLLNEWCFERCQLYRKYLIKLSKSYLFRDTINSKIYLLASFYVVIYNWKSSNREQRFRQFQREGTEPRP